MEQSSTKAEEVKKQNIFTKKFHPNFLSAIERAYGTFSLTEKTIFSIIAIAVFVLSITFFSRLYGTMLVEVPSEGGTYTEGIIGAPRFINPLLAVSDADRDLSTLIYSGLLKPTPEGNLVPDLAESYLISSDNKTYDFVLKDNLRFHDNTPLTTADIEFTIKKAQDPLIKSQKRSAWEGVTVNVIDAKHIQFVLKQPFAPFLENATLGILPKHIWKDASPDQFTFSVYNIEPIGSGPYKLKSLKENSLRAPIEYRLVPFNDYTFGKALIKKLNIKLYSNEVELVSAFENGDILSMGGVEPSIAREYENNGTKVETATLPRVFGVFFNQNQNEVLLNSTVRKALEMSVNRSELIEKVLKGYGIEIDTPFVPETKSEKIWSEESITKANELLEKNGWTLNDETGIREKKSKDKTTTLSFSLSTGEKNDLKTTADILKEQWKKIGADVSISIYENGDLNQNIIRPRKFDALLFGEIIGRDTDLYPFWHSSQRNDPGLNIAQYANIKTDKLLDELRSTYDATAKIGIIEKINAEMEKDIPAIFLYSPEYTYIPDPKAKAIDLGKISLPNERFLDIHKWYKDTNKIWNLFYDGTGKTL